MSHQIWISGKPIGKKRPRFARRGKFVITYNDQETEEGRFLLDLRQQWKEQPMGGPIALTLKFCMPIPKSYPKKKRDAILDREVKGDFVPHIVKPDLDNLIKFVKDYCNSIVWIDDAQVYTIDAEKYYGGTPGTRIEVHEYK